jgi:hypothetical protein
MALLEEEAAHGERGSLAVIDWEEIPERGKPTWRTTTMGDSR